ncbi:hypothetical protein [Pantoea agglomerans]|uniref:hypothetical protein n=1 Tax=Enterobacter agglomerans TaxID=549 RepID=UPI0010C1B33B|nr:hypothetical protein [Pantoea agglomerans]MBD8146531.1 hypothetical protein [Pantoea agglomerans]MBD8184515.1 hypothetical protein [Pantoea agglomerans]TKK12356.1 hypothetical protein PagCFBP13516_23835 [Pantoea agglomerans]TKK25060.1 hypothetical protein PagCFBP13532_23360 [Pantoea agglomerans]WVL80717.1 hypothetical protein IFT78_003110 [Pantoea agglomerans]
MPISHDDFLAIAKDAITHNGEIWIRNAISRSYYSLFHSTLRITEGRIPERDDNGDRLPGGIHQRLSDCLCNGSAADEFGLDKQEIKMIGLALRTAHHRRVTADYKLHKRINKIDAISLIQSAQETTKKIDGLLSIKLNAS